MCRTSLSSLFSALLGAGLCACAGLPARGQQPYYPPPPGYGGYGGYGPPAVTQPTQQTQVYGRPTAPPASYAPPPVNPNQYAPSYAPYAGAPYGNPYGSATGGGLTGAANAINAQGEFEQQFQQARLMNQQVERSKLDTKRAKIEEWMWERNNLPTLEDNRERDQYWQLRYVLNDPPPNEIWNGSALNTILTAIGQAQPPNAPGPTVYLPPGLTSQLSLTTGATSSGVGLLKNGPKLVWPYALQSDAFDADRSAIDKLMKTAYDQVSGGQQVDFKVLQNLGAKIDDIDATLKSLIEQMTPTDNIHGERYVRELRDTLKALQQPDASQYFASCRPVAANTVGQLVQAMTAQGQTFAPATNAAQPAYNALYNSMVAYYKLLTQPSVREMTASGPPQGTPPTR